MSRRAVFVAKASEDLYAQAALPARARQIHDVTDAPFTFAPTLTIEVDPGREWHLHGGISPSGYNLSGAPSRDSAHSALRSIAVGVRAALRPGRVATTLASTSAPIATRVIERTGTLGWGTA